jgi:hypothetical protein
MNNKCIYNNCKNNIGIYPELCFIHTLLLNNVFISKSNIKNAGNGLFAGPKGFKKGNIIGKYSTNKNITTQGDIVKKCPSDDRKCWEYVLCRTNDIKDNSICWDDNNNIKSTYTRYINDAFNSKYKNNSEFYIANDSVYVIATINIKPYEEIFISYGNNYWI